MASGAEEKSLRACPFCGSASVSLTSEPARPYVWVECDECSACGPTRLNDTEAVSMWNSNCKHRHLGCMFQLRKLWMHMTGVANAR